MLSFWEKESFLEYDYIIVGSGIVGLSAACSLAEKKPTAHILVLEKGIFPSGASTKNAGFACFGSPTEVWADIQKMGEEASINLVKKRIAGLQILRNRLGDHIIDYQAMGGYELISEKELYIIDQLPYLNQLFQEIFPLTYQLKDDLIHTFGFNAQSIRHLIFTPHEGQIDTGKMMKNLLLYAQHKKITILNGSDVTQINELGTKVSVIVQDIIEFKARKVVVCTNAFTKELFPKLEVMPGRGQVLVTQPLASPLLFKGNFHFYEGFYYFRNFENRVIFGGGRNLDFERETTTKISTTNLIINDLITKLHQIILPNQSFEIAHTWAGIMAFGKDKQYLLEFQSDNVLLGTRLNGMGVAIGSLLGEEIAEKLVNS